jgi:DNA polymerase
LSDLEDPYEALRARMKVCTDCQLCATRHEVVVDRGSPMARLLFIGESPGASEDASGQAFVGAAGQLLDELIAEAGIAADRFLIVNILKCRPPNNDFPGDAKSRFKVEDTVLKCLPWLDKQIEIVRPKVIVLVGNKAVQWTVYRNKPDVPPMAELLNKWIRSDRYPGVEVFAMYHTSYLLRSVEKSAEEGAGLRKTAITTLRWAADALQGELPEAEFLHVRSGDKRYEQMKFF